AELLKRCITEAEGAQYAATLTQAVRSTLEAKASTQRWATTGETPGANQRPGPRTRRAVSVNGGIGTASRLTEPTTAFRPVLVSAARSTILFWTVRDSRRRSWRAES